MKRPMDIAYDYLKNKILDGTLKPSQKLTEHELSETIGVSRNTVKKALLKLEQENLVKIESNKGAFIQSFTLDEVVNYLEIREVLEGIVARAAAANIQEAELSRMEQLLSQMELHLENRRFDEYSSLNKDFHNMIYSASGKAQAVEMIMIIKTQLLRYHFRTILVPGRNQESIKEHHAILAAMKSHDADRAEEAIRLHIRHIRSTIEQHFAILA